MCVCVVLLSIEFCDGFGVTVMPWLPTNTTKPLDNSSNMQFVASEGSGSRASDQCGSMQGGLQGGHGEQGTSVKPLHRQP